MSARGIGGLRPTGHLQVLAQAPAFSDTAVSDAEDVMLCDRHAAPGWQDVARTPPSTNGAEDIALCVPVNRPGRCRTAPWSLSAAAFLTLWRW
jgi:hypothetical protein